MKKLAEIKLTRFTLLFLVGIFGAALGAVFALPPYQRNFARVEFSGVAVAAEVASDAETQRAGLSGRTGIAEKSGMLFLFDHADYWSIWMKDMRFPIDILWIKNGRVADIEEHASAPVPGVSDSALPVYRPDVPADMVLEVSAGFARAHDLHIGSVAAISFKGAVLADGKTAEAAQLSEPGREYFIDSLRASPARGDRFKIGAAVEHNGAYDKFPIAYSAGGRTLTGIMNVPAGPAPEAGFPVLILNHGLIMPEIYFSGRGSKREQDFFARHGYITIHPDYRGYSSTSPEFSAHHDFYVGYTEDVIALIDAIKRADLTMIDTHRMGMWGHSMGGGIAARIAVLSPDIRAFVLFAPISASAEDNFYELSPEEIARLHDAYGPAGSDVYQKISPLSYFSDIGAPVQIHHGLADTAVPIAFSERMFAALRSFDKKAEFYAYPGEPHEFVNAWSLAASRALQFFDKYVKDAR